MKFANGFWYSRPGVTPVHAHEVYDVETTPDTLTVYAPVRHVRGRSGTTNSPLLTVHYSSPMENVIRVDAVHHAGAPDRSPEFEVFADTAASVKVEESDEHVRLSSGGLTVRVSTGSEWRVEFLADEHNGERRLTMSPPEAFGYVDIDASQVRPEAAASAMARLN